MIFSKNKRKKILKDMTAGYTGTTGFRIALEKAGWFNDYDYVIKVMNSVCRDADDPKFSPVQMSKAWIWGKSVLEKKSYFILRKLQKNSDNILAFGVLDWREVVEPYLNMIDNIHCYWPEFYPPVESSKEKNEKNEN